MTPRLHLEGDKALIRTLDSVKNSTRRRVVVPAVRAAIKPIWLEARKQLSGTKSRDTGLLRKSLGAIIKEYKAQGRVFGVAGPRDLQGVDNRGRKRDPRFYAHLIEYGVQPHTILPESQRAMKFGDQFAAAVEHPGFAQRPFLRPAFDKNKATWLPHMTREVKTRLEREIRKAKAKGKAA